MTLGIYIIGTNSYLPLAVRFIKRFSQFYRGKHDLQFILFSDDDPSQYLPESINFKYFETHHSSWVDGTNSKFKNIIENSNGINVDYLYYFDADTNIVEDFDDWFIGDLVAGEHYGNSSYMVYDPNTCDIYKKPFDRDPKSSCYLNGSEEHLTYFYGAFFGGRYSNVLDMLVELNKMMEFNKSQNYEPPVNDESYLNYYFNTNPVKIIKSSDFKFQISCKGGLENTRDITKNIDNLKDKMVKYKNSIIGFDNGDIIPITEFKNFNLNNTHCYYINPDSYNSRRESIEIVIHKLNCKQTKRINHCIGNNCKVDRCSISHIFALNQAISNDDFPLLILEDDAELIQPTFLLPNIPNDSVAIIYLGGSLYPLGGGVHLESYNDDYYRVYNMLSTHAIYIPNIQSAEIIKNIYENALNNNAYIDLDLAKNSHDLVFLTPKNGPYFYQNDGLTKDVTFFEWTNHPDLIR